MRRFRRWLALTILPKDRNSIENVIASCAGGLLNGLGLASFCCEWDYHGDHYRITAEINNAEPYRSCQNDSRQAEIRCNICTGYSEPGATKCMHCGSRDVEPAV